MALFTFIRVPFTHWIIEANSLLKERFVEERPALLLELACHSAVSDVDYLCSVENEYQPEVLPVMHADMLTHCESHLAIFPLNSPSFLQHTF